MSSKRKQFKIYGPPHFAPTWKKYLEICERDGRSASEEIRIFVEGQVRGRDPGNPQRPITAYAPGHRDQVVLQEQELFKTLQAMAMEDRGQLRWSQILEGLGDSLTGKPLVDAAKKLALRLHKAGVKIIMRS